MKRPILFALGFLAAGIWAGQSGFALFGLPVLAAVCAGLHARYQYAPVWVFLLLAGIGAACGHARRALPGLSYGQTASFTGTVTDTGLTGAGNLKLTVRLTDPNPETDGKNVLVYPRGEQNAAAGARITFAGRLDAPERALNPGGYDAWQYLRARKIDGQMFANALRVTGEAAPSFAGILGKAAGRLSAVYDAVLPPREASVLKAVILGDRDGLSEELIALYKTAGVYHLLCVSGLHISIIMLALARLLKLWMNERVAGLAALGVLILYAGLTGGSVSVARAVTMGGVLVMGRVLFRAYDTAASAAFAAIALLLYEPLYLFDAGFQLSFAAVFGIAFLTAPAERLLTRLRLPRALRPFMAANIAATLATLPLLSFHFYTLPLYSLPVNLLILPTAALLVATGLLTGLVGLFALPGATFLAGAAVYLLRFYEAGCAWFAALPFASLAVGCCGVIGAGLAYGVLVSAQYAAGGFGGAFRKRIWLPASAAAVCAAFLFFRAHPPGLTVAVLDGGPALCAVLRYQGKVWTVGDAKARVLADYLPYIGKGAPDFILPGEPPRDGRLTLDALTVNVSGGTVTAALGGAVFAFCPSAPARMDASVTVWTARGQPMINGEPAHGATEFRTDGEKMGMSKYVDEVRGPARIIRSLEQFAKS